MVPDIFQTMLRIFTKHKMMITLQEQQKFQLWDFIQMKFWKKVNYQKNILDLPHAIVEKREVTGRMCADLFVFTNFSNSNKWSSVKLVTRNQLRSTKKSIEIRKNLLRHLES